MADNGSQLYGVVFLSGIIVVSLLEWATPRRPLGTSPGVRWLSNFGFTVLGAVLVRALFPLFGVAWALYCRDRGFGLFNAVHVAPRLAFIVSILALDAVAYGQHVVLHKVPLLWRIHRTHHSDLECDFSTGLRFHPFETVYTTAALGAAILALGAPPTAVLVSRLLSLALDFIEHANLRMPEWLDRALQLIVVTPDMHHIHHSQDLREGESNFSNTFPWWDWIFGTYLDQPASGHDAIAFGVTELSDRKHVTLPWMLAQPFLSLKRSAPRLEPQALARAEPGHGSKRESAEPAA